MLANFTEQRIDAFATRYNGEYKGHQIEILRVSFKGDDYSLTVDGNAVFVGLREPEAKKQISAFIQKL